MLEEEVFGLQRRGQPGLAPPEAGKLLQVDNGVPVAGPEGGQGLQGDLLLAPPPCSGPEGGKSVFQRP